MCPSLLDSAVSLFQSDLTQDQAVSQADVVVEAIPEKMELKHTLFRKIDVAAPAHAIFASNTSSLSIGEASLSVSLCSKARK